MRACKGWFGCERIAFVRKAQFKKNTLIKTKIKTLHLDKRGHQLDKNCSTSTVVPTSYPVITLPSALTFNPCQRQDA